MGSQYLKVLRLESLTKHQKSHMNPFKNSREACVDWLQGCADFEPDMLWQCEQVTSYLHTNSRLIVACQIAGTELFCTDLLDDHVHDKLRVWSEPYII